MQDGTPLAMRLVMSNYENAPATEMVATHCAACCRPLVDAVSVEAGMGPDCRKKYMRAETSPEHREEVNKLVHALALTVSQKGEREAAAKAIAMIGRVRELGFEKLAEKLQRAYVVVTIEIADGIVRVVTPYNEHFTVLARQIPGRRWVAEQKVNTFPVAAREALYGALSAAFPGAAAMGPKGGFLLPG